MGNFNSRPCARGDRKTRDERPETKISILAPARGATTAERAEREAPRISILAPARGATTIEPTLDRRSGNFNSRPCARGDYIGKSIFKKTDISILAPARGATTAERAEREAPRISILAPARGATFVFVFASCRGCISILAPARGATDGT